jgi:hypothetical protein
VKEGCGGKRDGDAFEEESRCAMFSNRLGVEGSEDHSCLTGSSLG